MRRSRINDDGTKTYIDKVGRTWIIERVSLPKKRGEYTFYLAESADKVCKSFRSKLYREILDLIDEKVSNELNPYY